MFRAGLKLSIILVLLSHLFAYFKWGSNQSSFLFEIEAQVLSKLFTDPASVIHPFILLPLAGQVLLLLAVFTKNPPRLQVFAGTGLLALLVTFLLFIGILGRSPAIIFSTLPFHLSAWMTIRHFHRKRGEVIQ